MNKIITGYEDLAPTFCRHNAVFDGYDGSPESTDKIGTGSSEALAVRNLINQCDECESDCSLYCIGCGEYFHNIKCDAGLPHDEELDDAIRTNAGDHYCHPDCCH